MLCSFDPAISSKFSPMPPLQIFQFEIWEKTLKSLEEYFLLFNCTEKRSLASYSFIDLQQFTPSVSDVL